MIKFGEVNIEDEIYNFILMSEARDKAGKAILLDSQILTKNRGPYLYLSLKLSLKKIFFWLCLN